MNSMLTKLHQSQILKRKKGTFILKNMCHLVHIYQTCTCWKMLKEPWKFLFSSISQQQTRFKLQIQLVEHVSKRNLNEGCFICKSNLELMENLHEGKLIQPKKIIRRCQRMPCKKNRFMSSLFLFGDIFLISIIIFLCYTPFSFISLYSYSVAS